MEKIKIDSKFADQAGEILVVQLGGYVDQSNSYQLEKMFDDIIQSGCYKVVVDFNKLAYMSSAGWGVFVGEIKRFRENGGDIKLAHMNPEINDVYQMLEFYHILEDFQTVEEAARSFKKDQEVLDLVLDDEDESETDDDVEVEEGEISTEEIEFLDSDNSGTASAGSEAEVIEFTPSKDIRLKDLNEFIPHTITQDIKLADLPLPEKVKRVIAQNPLVGIIGIKKILKHEHFGKTKVGFFKLFQLLVDLDLNSKAKRYRYYRSC